MKRFTHSILLVVFVHLPACAAEDEEGIEFRTTLGTGSGGGPVFNTNQIDDHSVSELLQPMGVEHQDFALQSVELAGGKAAAYFTIEDGDIVVHDEQGGIYTGVQLLESLWSLSGVSIFMTPLRLSETVKIDGWPHFRFVRGPDDQGTCVGGPDPIYARMLPGFTLDEDTGKISPLPGNTYVACTNGATGKAAAWGYYDLAAALDDWDALEVAIRAIRADYCYKGVPYTKVGVPLEIEDRWGVRPPGTGTIEAMWGRDGLICRNLSRSGPWPTCAVQGTPPCAEDVMLASFPEALFITRLP
jgi:hypothetical protein